MNAALFSSASPEWLTPDWIISAVQDVLGTIDLDPCSNSKEFPNVPALTTFTKDSEPHPFNRNWRGTVYMNPPYGRGINGWVGKLVYEYNEGNVPEAIALVPSRTDTGWFNQLADAAVCWCAIEGRVKFGRGNGGSSDPAPFPSALMYLGHNVPLFYRTFSEFGRIYYQVPSGVHV
ncbi:MAG: DNA N-6-adenine-methyltransferase [bacterium]